VTRGRIGVGIQNVTKDLADSLGLGKAAGAAVSNVEEGSPAAKAGLEVGDVITKIDGHVLEDGTDLIALVRKYAPESVVAVEYRRGTKIQTASVTLAADAK
jgi:putative serine protease PepD